MGGEPMKSRQTNSVDARVGQRIRLRRLLIRMSQEDLAGRLGITFQQIQKYEKGRNRITAGRLFDVAVILGVPVSSFYEKTEVKSSEDALTKHDQRVMEFVTTAEGRELRAAFLQIKSVIVRRRILDLVRSLIS
jgi:transcriptional regulator with XRE-family HTH domain